MSADSARREGRHEWRPGKLGEAQRRSKVAFGALALILMVVLGIGIAAQVRDTGGGDSLDTARPEDLLVVLDTLGRQEASLREEVSTLRQTLTALEQSDGGSGAALDEARDRLSALAIAVGTVVAEGPGVVLTIEDRSKGVGSDVLLDCLQELRAAGAEAIELSGSGDRSVRIGVDSWIAGAAGAVIADGSELSAPYVFTAIGDPPTLAAALNIPGGVVDTVARNGGTLTSVSSDLVTVAALRDPRPRQYAQPGN